MSYYTAKRRYMSFFLCILSAIPLYAVNDFELHHRILNIQESSKPYFTKDTVLFTFRAPTAVKLVALAFEHEQYRQIHTYERNPFGIFVLEIPIPDDVEKLRYRLIVDGFWTTDPNSEILRDSLGIPVSSIDLPVNSMGIKTYTHRLDDGSIRFVFQGFTGSSVSVTGDFNSWDPYLTKMQESLLYPGIYSVDLHLPPESQYYRFVVNGQVMTDPGNPLKVKNGWSAELSIMPPAL